jgi:multidrug resistance efflux pump
MTELNSKRTHDKKIALSALFWITIGAFTVIIFWIIRDHDWTWTRKISVLATTVALGFVMNAIRSAIQKHRRTVE